jgi:hypothetical protein
MGYQPEPLRQLEEAPVPPSRKDILNTGREIAEIGVLQRVHRAGCRMRTELASDAPIALTRSALRRHV